MSHPTATSTQPPGRRITPAERPRGGRCWTGWTGCRAGRYPASPLSYLGLAYVFVFYDITDIGFGMPAIVKQFQLSTNDVKFVAIAIGLVGYIVGSNLIGVLAHRRGRRLAFLVSLLIAGVGSLGSAFATGFVSLSIWRFLTGMASARPSTWRRHMWGSCLPPRSEVVSR